MSAATDAPVLNRYQRRVLLLAANGLTDHEIAASVGRSYDTVRTHLGAAYRALGARDRAHAVALAMATGWITRADIQAGGTAVREAS